MSTRSLRKIVLAVLTAMLLLSFSVPALANPPVHGEDWEQAFVNEPLVDCGDFWIIENGRFAGRNTFFYDNEGELKWVQTQVTYHGTFTNPLTGDSITDSPDHQTVIYYPEQGYQYLHGLFISVNIPGEGLVALDAGTIIFNEDGEITFQSGPHHVNGDYTVFCDALR